MGSVFARQAPTAQSRPPQTRLERLVLPPRELAIHQQGHAFLKTEIAGRFALGQFTPGLRHAVQPHGFQFVEGWLM